MRLSLLLFGSSLIFSTSLAVADEPEYIDDTEVKRSIEAQADTLMQADKTTPNAILQEQLAAEPKADFAPPSAFELTKNGEDIYDTVDDGVLIIGRMYLCGRCDLYHASCSSGFVISEDGLAVTNHHVMQSKDKEDDTTMTYVAMTRDGKVYPIKEVLASSIKDDLALIQLDGDGFTPLPIARSAEIGERVHAVTNPSGRFYTYSSGQISRFFVKPPRKNDPRVGAKRVTVTSDYGGGSSGGPIFNDKGQVVAVVSEAHAVRDHKIVHYDSVPYSAILELFESKKQARE